MAEEEQGHTFVDKRRVQAETAETQTPPAAEPQPQAVPEFDAPAYDDQDEDGEGGAPDVYSLLGYCVSLLSAQAWQCLGLLADPQTGETQPDLAQAKVAIDAVGDLAAHLETAPREAVPDNLRRDLRTLVNDLRLNYVARQNQPAA